LSSDPTTHRHDATLRSAAHLMQLYSPKCLETGLFSEARIQNLA
jgi:hypothetical protein